MGLPFPPLTVAVAFLGNCPRCALGREAWLEVRNDQFSFYALAILSPFLGVLLLVGFIEAWMKPGGKRTRRALDEVGQ
jgi:hypothetical protein